VKLVKLGTLAGFEIEIPVSVPRFPLRSLLVYNPSQQPGSGLQERITMIGQTISHYKIVEKLGQGGMGIVYKAQDTRLDRFVAVKILPAEWVSDPERRRRFVQEAKAASALNHPNIVTIHDFDSADDVRFIVMEYVPGRTLDRLIGGRGMKLGEALGLAAQIADALAKAHAAGIVHRDLKPSNIMVTEHGAAKVLDFGLAKLTERSPTDEYALTASFDSAPKTEEGTIIGTVDYMSPEQAEGKKIDARSDIFSFGSVLYEMLTGKPPFRGETRASTLASIIGREPKPLREAAPDLPDEVEHGVLRCLRKDPQRRWQHMDDLMAMLRDLKEDSDSGKLAAAPYAAPARRGRLPWLLAAAGLVLAVAVFVALQFLRPPAAPGLASVSRFTFDSGVTLDPAISRDGKLAAFASDRAGKENLDIWVQQFEGREPIQRTHSDADERQPSLSPDGFRIAFRSERDGGGIYVMDALAGEERRIADGGFSPRFSPDGSRILYWDQAAIADARLNKMYLIPSQGGSPKPFQAEFGAAYPPIWSPDGKHVLFAGVREKKESWWIAPADGGPAVAIGVPEFPSTSVASYFRPEAWVGNQIVFLRGIAVEGVNAYRISLSSGAWKLAGKVQQITSGPGLRVTAAVAADGRMLIPICNVGMNLATVSLDANSGTSSGDPRLFTQDSTTKAFACMSGDGTKAGYVAYVSSLPRRFELRIKDMQKNRETAIPAESPSHTRLSRDGSRFSYREPVGGKSVSLIGSSSTATGRQVCEGCTILDFFSDPDESLVRYGNNRLVRQDFTRGRQSEILQTGAGSIVDAALSDDDRWVCFLLAKPSGRSAIVVAPAGNAPVPEQEWITILDEAHVTSVPRWSPDGNLLYFLSDRDGYDCLWAQRLAAGTKRPVNAPFGVYHDHLASAKAALAYAPRGGTMRGLDISKDKFLWYQIDVTSNIWLIQLPVK